MEPVRHPVARGIAADPVWHPVARGITDAFHAVRQPIPIGVVIEQVRQSVFIAVGEAFHQIMDAVAIGIAGGEGDVADRHGLAGSSRQNQLQAADPLLGPVGGTRRLEHQGLHASVVRGRGRELPRLAVTAGFGFPAQERRPANRQARDHDDPLEKGPVHPNIVVFQSYMRSRSRGGDLTADALR